MTALAPIGPTGGTGNVLTRPPQRRPVPWNATGAVPGSPTPPPGPMIAPSAPPGMGGMPAVAPQQPPYGSLTNFGPGNNLIGTQINPTDAADTASARTTTGQLLGSLATAPNRQDLAQNLYDALSKRETANTGAQIRDLGQRAAALGRLGSGMVTSEAGDIFGQREANLAAIKAGLSSETAGQTLQDYINRLSAARGVTGEFSALDQAKQEALRGERGYQAGLESSATDRAVQQRLLEEQLQQGQYGRDQGVNSLLAQYGFSDVNPLQTYIAQNYQEQGAGGTDALAALLQSLGRSKGGQARPGLTPAIQGGP